MDFPQHIRAGFLAWLAPLPKSIHLHVLCDSDADGLPSGAILYRALHQAGYANTTTETRRKSESAWGEEVRARLETLAPEALIVADLGSREGDILPDIPLLLLDHHRPLGQPSGSTLLTAYGTGDPEGDGKDVPTTGLLAYWCAQALLGEAAATSLLWLCGISLLSDLGDKAPFPELAAAKKAFGGGALRDATSLLNASRRTAQGRADSALALLLKANGPKDVTNGTYPETAELLTAKAEVSQAIAESRKRPPRFSKTAKAELGVDVIMVRIATGAQVHPLVAMRWRSTFPKAIIFGVNTGYRQGFVHFSGRSPAGVNLLEYLATHRPPEADFTYGLGHNQASGGALPVAVFNRWVRELGFGEEMEVQE